MEKNFNKDKADLVFVNYRDAECGCKIIFSDGKGYYSDVIYIKLCKTHKRKHKDKNFKFKVGQLVSSHPVLCKTKFMPGVGKIIAILDKLERPYICEHNDKLYRFNEEEIYEYDPY